MIDLTRYTGIYREGRFLRFGNMINKKEFPTIREAKKFENLYNFFAIEALEKMVDIIKKYGVVRDASKLSQKDLAVHASHYYQGGGIGGNVRGPTLDDVLKKTEEVYNLGKDIKLLRELGII